MHCLSIIVRKLQNRHFKANNQGPLLYEFSIDFHTTCRADVIYHNNCFSFFQCIQNIYCSSYIAQKSLIPTLTLKFSRCIKKLGKFRRSTQDLLKDLDVYNIITKFHEYTKKMHAKHPLGQEYAGKLKHQQVISNHQVGDI